MKAQMSTDLKAEREAAAAAASLERRHENWALQRAVVVVEYIFTLDGSGYLLFEAAKVRDVPVVVGVSLFFIAAVILMNLVLDLVKAKVDPREVTRVE